MGYGHPYHPAWLDDRRNTKAEALRRRAIVLAGFPQALADHADCELRNVGD